MTQEKANAEPRRGTLPLVRIVLFVVLSLADLHLTQVLIRQGHGQFDEGNPVAGAWLKQYGFPGLVIFKIGALSVVGAIALFLSVYRPRTGRWLLNFACLTVGAVAVYSCLLLARAANAPPPTTLTDPDAKSEAAQYAD